MSRIRPSIVGETKADLKSVTDNVLESMPMNLVFLTVPSLVLLLFARFAAANQDEEQFENALQFDIMRPNLKDHVAFGKGVHHCLGAALSRREMNGGFKVIFNRMENFRLAPGASEPEFSANALLHGLTGLELAFDKIA